MASSKKKFVSNSEDTIRMFKSDFLEAFSKVHWTVPLYVFIPVIGYCIYRSAQTDLLLWQYPLVILAGIFIWTLTEYVLHRWVFHYELPGKWGARLHFVIHGVHHDYPSDKMRLVLPPSLSIPLALAFFFLFKWLIPEVYLWMFFATFIAGYLFYDISHYAMHHFNFKSGLFKKIKQHHMLHHYQDPEKGFGVSSPLWDLIIGSVFSKKDN
ncbi:Fatty acid hydroxylase superfamily protein [Pedobacter westerhofensis]|uniref:Fatty acid hydroxylase superfamily protein n=1 Tax=Pedobacter westerhofensis TaxID=425512 RepID=A0A521EL81_9SPHI|nr:sterol desaturase family protein [Pedobacter westerhofensis]SMO84679.1 Fatty acid hydroxylase superfamily protein [Pedobacter westerhofensis]